MFATGPTAYNDAFALETRMPDELQYWSRQNRSADQVDEHRRKARTRFLRDHGVRELEQERASYRDGILEQNFLGAAGLYLHTQVQDLPTHYDATPGHVPTAQLYCGGRQHSTAAPAFREWKGGLGAGGAAGVQFRA